jgi:lysophospholipase L1-like esterase
MKSPGATRYLLLAGLLLAFAGHASAADAWVGTWASAMQRVETANLPPPPGLGDTTLRQVVHVSIGGKTVRARFSNTFGDSPLTLTSVHLAVSAGGSAIKAGSDIALTFGGASSVTIPPGAEAVSDAATFELEPLSSVAFSIHLLGAPVAVTGHPGSRTTSYLSAGNLVSAPDLPPGGKADHWYFITGLDVLAQAPSAAVVVLGDSITDGRGSTTNGNDRWTDQLARILQAGKGTRDIGVLNAGIGGNSILHNGIGPSALSRFDRDVIDQPGVRWLIILEGVNDLGGAVKARALGKPAATAGDIIAAYEKFVAEAHEHGIRAYGATIMPFEGFASYFTPESEADRQKVNEWIRRSGVFDGVVDLDLALRDGENPSFLSSRAGSSDHLHPGPSGHEMIAETVDLGLFAR